MNINEITIKLTTTYDNNLNNEHFRDSKVEEYHITSSEYDQIIRLIFGKHETQFHK